ncbi:MAG: HlyD family type I secretion periplasmic adaptor subunit [Desulfurivibrionaceae bacterium]
MSIDPQQQKSEPDKEKAELPWNDASAAGDLEEAEEAAADKPVLSPPESGDMGVRRFGLLVLVVVFGIFGIWAAVAPLSSAVISQGMLVVEAYRKSVQHLQGGQVEAILVKDGDAVAVGQTLIRLDNTQLTAQFDAALPLYAEFLAQESRLLAERDRKQRVIYSPEFLAIENHSLKAELTAGQDDLFLARQRERSGQRQILEQRKDQISRQISGVRAVIDSSRSRLAMFAEEIAEWQILFDQQLTDKMRLRELKKEKARLEGEIASSTAEIARLELVINQTDSEILQKDREFEREVATSLREVQVKLSESRSRVLTLRDALTKTDLKAPVAGVVVGLDVHTLGGVIQPGKTVLEVVPANERLLVKVRFAVNDIDRVQTGLDAEIQFSSFNTQVPHSIDGKVSHVSADSFIDQRTGMPYYEALVDITESGIKELARLRFDLVPGMPVQVMIKAGSRTMLEYLVQPLSKMFTNAFREK